MGEKKRRLTAGGPASTTEAGRRIAQAFDALRRGDRAAAVSAFDAARATQPHDADTLHALGVLGLQVGDASAAVDPLVRAIELDPRQPTYRCHLAIAYRRVGSPDLAIRELEAALRLDPGLAEAHSNLGNLLRERGDSDAAVESYGRALAIRPDFPDAINGLGLCEHARGRFDVACAHFEHAVALDRTFHEAWYNLSRSHAESTSGEGDFISSESAVAALESILAALQLHQQGASYWIQLENCVANLDLRHPVDPRMRDTLIRALDHPDVDPARLVRPIVSLAITGPDGQGLDRRRAVVGSFAAIPWLEARQHVAGFLADPLLPSMLEANVVASPFVQDLLAYARRSLLHECARVVPKELSLPLPAIAAMAHQAFSTEYVAEESDDERAEIVALGSVIAAARASGAAVPLCGYAIYACYRSLDTLPEAEQIAADVAASPLRRVALRQIVEPREEMRVAPTIAVLTGVAGGVSAAVRGQYEANPYPRWQRVRRTTASASVFAYLRERFPHADLDGVVDAPSRILVAGCGTGRHPVATALRFPDSTVLAVDLSLASLAYAKRKTHALAIDNVEYGQADLLAMGSFGERFDVIECTGVLHHLEDPEAGWRILCSLLRPSGVMRIGLYSEAARRHVVRAREFVAVEGFAATPDGIRACRAAILARRDDALLARVARGEDFYSLSGCRDLVFHVQEHRFTLPQIAALLARLRLRFVGFEFPDSDASRAYRARYPGDSAMADLDRWHELEAARPDTFALMYQFWVRKVG